MPKFSICFPNKIYPVGGSGTFIKNFKKYLTSKKYNIFHFKNKKKIDYILVTGSNLRNAIPIFYNKLLGSKIINRVDGKNWTYKYGPKDKINYIYSILQNLNVFLFQLLSDKIIYQSNFVKKVWNHKLLNKKSTVIYNASKPNYRERKFTKKRNPTLISVEGSVDSAFKASNLINSTNNIYKYEIYGKVSKKFKTKFKNSKNVKFYGQVSRNKIKKVLKKNKKYIFICLEMYPPCPNSVIEALNHGIPTIGYNQGSMGEIINNKYGKLIKVDRNLNFNKLELLGYIKAISKNYLNYSKNLKKLENKFKLNYMLKKYENEINKT